jgi:hypothetical protein
MKTDVFTLHGQVENPDYSETDVEVYLEEIDPDGTKEFRQYFLPRKLFEPKGLWKSGVGFDLVTSVSPQGVTTKVMPAQLTAEEREIIESWDDSDLDELEAIEDEAMRQERARRDEVDAPRDNTPG